MSLIQALAPKLSFTTAVTPAVLALASIPARRLLIQFYFKHIKNLLRIRPRRLLIMRLSNAMITIDHSLCMMPRSLVPI